MNSLSSYAANRSRMCAAPFGLAASATRALLSGETLRSVGHAVFMPTVLGWAPSIIAVVVVMALWWAFATWNEETHRFSKL